MYRRTTWKDNVTNPPNRFKLTPVSGSENQYDITRAGIVMEPGTDQDEDHFNNMEHGISDASAAVAVILTSMGHLLDAVAVEKHVATLTNTDRYPFNNSAQTIALNERRNNLDYSVEAEVLSHVGTVGDVVIYDKQLNGFKVKFEGSGKSATVLLKITGGL